MNASRTMRLLLAAVVALGATTARAVAWTLVAREGGDAPPVPSPHVFDTLADVSVRGDGTVFFSNIGPGSSDPALYRWSAANGVELLTRLDLPDGPLGDPAYSIEAGFVAVGSQNEGPLLVDRPASLDACPSSGLVDEATFSVSEAGDLVPLSQPGAPVPGLDPGWIFGWGQGVLFDSYRQVYGPTPAVSASGELAFFAAAVLTDACSNDSLAPYASAVFGPDGSGGTALVAIPQQPAPGAPAGSALIPKDSVALALDDLGDVAFSADVRLGPSLPVVPAIYRWNAPGGLQLVARQYGPAPQGQTFSGPKTFHLGDGGHLVFLDVGPGSFPDNFRGLYLHDEIDGLRALVQLGDPLPGLSPSFGAQAAIAFAVNTLGDVAFSMRALRSADGLVRSGMWGPDAEGNTVLRLIAGRSAPGLGSARIQRTEVLALSDEREILFKASLSTVDASDYAFYLLDVNGHFRLLLRNRDLHELSPGVPEALTFQAAPLQWDADLRHFGALLYDEADAPVIVSTEVPEPGALLAGVVAVASLIATRRRA